MRSEGEAWEGYKRTTALRAHTGHMAGEGLRADEALDEAASVANAVIAVAVDDAQGMVLGAAGENGDGVVASVAHGAPMIAFP